MPLFPGKRNIGHNIETEQQAGKPHAQAVAIALDIARRKVRAEGGAADDSSDSGPIGATPAVGLAAGSPQPSFRKNIQGITDDWSYRPKAKSWESTFNVKAPEDPHGYIPFAANAYKLEPDDSPVSKPVMDIHQDKPMEFNFVNVRSGYGAQQNKFGVVGTGHAKEVISQASQRAVGALQKFKPPMMLYSAEEPSRARLYEHLTRNLGVDNYKGYRLNIPGDDRAVFAAVRQDNPERLANRLRAEGIEMVPLDRTSSRRGFAEGGHVKLSKFHSGPIHSSVAGRTDHLPVTVASGSYVLPADCVSHLGESNTLAGFKVLRRMFGGGPYGQTGNPYGQSGGPYGEPLPRARGGSVHRAAGVLFLSPEKEVLLMRRTGKDHQGEWALPGGGLERGETPEQAARRETEEEAGHSHEGGLSPFMHSNREGVEYNTFLAHSDRFSPRLNNEHDGALWIKPSEAEKLPLHPGVRKALEKLRARKAHGGEASGVPIVAAGGEWVIPPHHVEDVGGGDMDAGHRTLDKFVLHIRKEQIDKLKKMAPPRKD